jgi:hypothetical protein
MCAGRRRKQDVGFQRLIKQKYLFLIHDLQNRALK